MAHEPGDFVKVRRRGKTRTSGAQIYINADVLCMALTHAGMDCAQTNLQAKASACKDGKRAKIIIHITKVK